MRRVDTVTGRACIYRIDGDATDRGFTTGDLDRLIENFNARKAGTSNDVPAPWHLGHEDDRKVESAFLKALVRRTDLPALAEPTKLWRKGAELWSEVKVPTPALPLLTLYPYRSAEIYRDYHGQGPTLKGVGMLGATQPAKKGLGPVVLNDATGGEYVCAPSIDEPLMFMEGEVGAMGPKILAKIQAIAAADEGKTTDSVLQEVAQAARLDSAGLLGLLTGQSDVVLSSEQAAAMANVLGMTMDEIQTGMGGAPDDEAIDEDEEEDMAEKKPAVKPEAKPELPTDGAVTAEQFAELRGHVEALRTRDREKDELLKAQRATIASLQTEGDKLRVERFHERVDLLVKADLLDAGRISPAHKDQVTKLLRQYGGVEKFAEGEAGLTATIDLLKELLPAKAESAVRRPVTQAPRDQRVKQAVAAFAAQRATGMQCSFETFAEAAHALSPEEIAAAMAALPAHLKA